MSARNRFFILLGIIFVISLIYYVFSADHSKDLVLIGTVDSNQSDRQRAGGRGRIQKLLVDEGTPVKGRRPPDCGARPLRVANLRRRRPRRTSPACSTRWQRCSIRRNLRRVLHRATWLMLRAKLFFGQGATPAGEGCA